MGLEGLEGRQVLFISYNGMLDPLGQSQVLPYLRELTRCGLRFTLLSFEKPNALAGDGEQRCEELRRSLAAEHIEWHWLRYHQRPSLPATIFDVVMGTRLARQLIAKHAIELVHARSHIPATMALALKRQLGVKLIFDVRGLLADEYVDAGHWQRGSIPYRLTKAMERRALAGADGVVTLTEAIWPVIERWDGLRDRQDVVHEVVPCCADLDLFKFRPTDRERRRRELGISDRFVVVYSGSIDGWYLTEHMADFFLALRQRRADAHLLWLTPARHERIRDLMRERAIDRRAYSVLASPSSDVPSYLAAGDAGLAFIKPCFSKLASSPTKYAEYLGCGLPLIINSGIGDSDALISQEGIGALVTGFNEVEYGRAIQTIESFAHDVDQTRRQTRAVAERLLNVRTVGLQRYARLYERILK